MNKKELDILERVQNSERQDKLNQWLELAMTATGDDFEIALSAAQHGENALRELVDGWLEDVDDPTAKAILILALDNVDWKSLMDYLLEC